METAANGWCLRFRVLELCRTPFPQRLNGASPSLIAQLGESHTAQSLSRDPNNRKPFSAGTPTTPTVNLQASRARTRLKSALGG